MSFRVQGSGFRHFVSGSGPEVHVVGLKLQVSCFIFHILGVGVRVQGSVPRVYVLCTCVVEGLGFRMPSSAIVAFRLFVSQPEILRSTFAKARLLTVQRDDPPCLHLQRSIVYAQLLLVEGCKEAFESSPYAF